MWKNIVNPKTGEKVNLQTKKGQQIINRYIFQLGGSQQTESKVETKEKIRDYKDLPTAKVVSYHFPDDFQMNDINNIDTLAEIDEEEESEIWNLLNKDKVYLQLDAAENEQERKERNGEIEKPIKPNKTVFIENRWCFNPKWINKTDEHGRQLLSCDTQEEVNDTEVIYKAALKKWNKIANGTTNYINSVMQKEKEKKKRVIEALFNGLKDGDIIENLNRHGMHDRNSGWYVMRNGTPYILSENEGAIDDELFPDGFSLGSKFPVGYWNNAKSINGEHFPGLLEPMHIGTLIKLLEKSKYEHFIEHKFSSHTLSIVYFDWGALEFPYPKKDVLKKIKSLKSKYERLYFEKKSRGISRLVVERYDDY